VQAQDRADEAYTEAGTAQAAADKEILAFFSAYSSVPEATGNGDVWIVTDHLISSDASLNAAAIHVANTKTGGIPDAGTSGQHYWHTSPNNAIGLTYAESYHSGVSGSYDRGSNRMPRGYSTFDERVADYNLIDDTLNAAQSFAVHEQDLPYPIHTLKYWNYDWHGCRDI
jgi:hypothetical protein